MSAAPATPGRVVGLVALLGLLVACGGAVDPGAGGGSPTGTGPDSPVSTSAPTGAPGSPTAETVEPQPGMVDVHPVAFDRAAPIGERTIEVLWWSGVRPCHVLARVDVVSSPDRITITLYEGSEPSDEPVACIELAQRKRTVVELSEPVDGRRVVDGARQ